MKGVEALHGNLHYEIHYETRFARTLPRSRASPGGKPTSTSNRSQTRPPRHTLPTLKAPRSKQSVSNTPAPLSNLLAELSRQQLSSILPHVVAGWRQNRHANQVCAALENDRSDVELSLNCRRVRNVADELGPEALVVQFSAALEPLSAL